MLAWPYGYTTILSTRVLIILLSNLRRGDSRYTTILKKKLQKKLYKCEAILGTAKMPCGRIADGHAQRWRAGGGVPPKGKTINTSKHTKTYQVELKDMCMHIYTYIYIYI